MTLETVMNWLKANIASEVWSRGSIDSTHDKALALYQLQSDPFRTTFVSKSSYRVKRFSLLVHWSKNYDQAEAKAIEIFKFLETPTTLPDGAISLTLIYDQPMALGKDDNKIYEFNVDFLILVNNEGE